MEDAVSISSALPGVVDIDVDVACFSHAIGDHGVRGGPHVCIDHPLGKVVPAVPAHGWRWGQRHRPCGLRAGSSDKAGEQYECKRHTYGLVICISLMFSK